jgi:hypothetical protein
MSLTILGHNWDWWQQSIRGWLYGYCGGCDYELGCGMKCEFCDAPATTYRYHDLTCKAHKKLAKKPVEGEQSEEEKLLRRIFSE